MGRGFKRAVRVDLKIRNKVPSHLVDGVVKVFHEGPPNDPFINVEAFAIAHLLGLPVRGVTDEMFIRTQETVGISVLPIGPDRLASRVSAPLVSAERLYCLGEYLATIALAGIVAETLCQYVWDAELAKRENMNVVSEKSEQDLFGRTFERLDQIRRIAVLRHYEMISSSDAKLLNEIREIRKKYLHKYLEFPEKQIKKDALGSFRKIAQVAQSIWGISGRPERQIIDKRLLRYIAKHSPELVLEIPE